MKPSELKYSFKVRTSLRIHASDQDPQRSPAELLDSVNVITRNDPDQNFLFTFLSFLS